jgi:hypothetical protein
MSAAPATDALLEGLAGLARDVLDPQAAALLEESLRLSSGQQAAMAAAVEVLGGEPRPQRARATLLGRPATTGSQLSLACSCPRREDYSRLSSRAPGQAVAGAPAPAARGWAAGELGARRPLAGFSGPLAPSVPWRPRTRACASTGRGKQQTTSCTPRHLSSARARRVQRLRTSSSAGAPAQPGCAPTPGQEQRCSHMCTSAQPGSAPAACP